MSVIPFNKYAKLLEDLPILCVDIIVQNSHGEYLLIKRANEPKKNRWWVIGGRVLKGETLRIAAMRKVKQEIGLRVKNLRPVGYFELVNGVNPFGLKFRYHTISIVFRAIIDDHQKITLDNQSLGFKFTKQLPSDFKVRLFEEKI